MNTRTAGLVVLCGFLMFGAAGLEAHHAVAGVYDLNKEMVLRGPAQEVELYESAREHRAHGPEQGWQGDGLGADHCLHTDADPARESTRPP